MELSRVVGDDDEAEAVVLLGVTLGAALRARAARVSGAAAVEDVVDVDQ